MSDRTIRRDARLSTCGRYRFTLSRRWGDGSTVLFIGCNPSTADHQVDDPTVLRWIHFARAWGFDGFVAVNLYPFRTSSPKELRRWADWQANDPDWYARDALLENLEIIRDQAAAAALIVPCWGALAWDANWTEQVIETVFEVTDLAEIHCLGETAGGAPIHPMARGRHRVPNDRLPLLWRSM